MKFPKVLMSFVFGLGLSLAPLASAQSVRSINKVPGRIESTAQRLTHALQNQGLEVSRGYVKLWTSSDCEYTFTRLGLCFGNNPAAPYVAVTVPQWPDEDAIPEIATVWGSSPAGYEDLFRFDPREAIVILAQMPPPALYFSEQSFVFTREGTYNTSSQTYIDIINLTEQGALPDFVPGLFFRQVPDVSDRVFLFSSLSNPINNVVMENRAEKEREAGTVFNQPRYFIITPDKFMDNAVRKAFASVSVEDEDIFTEHIPSYLRVGLSKSSDDFVTLFRYAQPLDGGGTGTPSDTWRKNLPLVVLRVRDRSHAAQPYTAPYVEQPRTAFNEYTLQPDLYNLLSQVYYRWNGLHCQNPDCSDVGATPFLDFQVYPIYMQGTLCEPIGENCLGDNWDAAYNVIGRYSVDNGEVYALVGTLGTRTGNATYVALGINQVSRFNGVGNLSDQSLDGTASGFAGEVNNTDSFFVYYFARDCSAIKALTENHCLEINEELIPAGDSIAFSVRDYLRPGTERGPDSTKVMHPYLMRVK
jgi:hypothetical protein